MSEEQAALNGQDTGSQDAGSGGGEQPWYAELPEDITVTARGDDGTEKEVLLREFDGLGKYKSQGEAIKALVHAQRKLGERPQGLVPPGENATDEERSAFQAEVRRLSGVPEKPEDYGIEVEGMDEDALGGFLKFAHDSGMNKAQAEALISRAQEEHKAQVEAAERHAHEQMSTLEKEWGQDFKPNMERATQALKVIDPSGEFQKFLESYDSMREPQVLKALKSISDMMGEGRLKQGGSDDGPGLTHEQLKEMRADPRYKTDKDYRRRVKDGYAALFPGTQPPVGAQPEQ